MKGIKGIFSSFLPALPLDDAKALLLQHAREGDADAMEIIFKRNHSHVQVYLPI